MSAKTNSYDSACESLAEYFLGQPHDPGEAKELAQHVQDAVEDWLRSKEREDKDRAVVQATVAKQTVRQCPKCGSSGTKYETGMGERLTCFDCGHIGPPAA